MDIGDFIVLNDTLFFSSKSANFICSFPGKYCDHYLLHLHSPRNIYVSQSEKNILHFDWDSKIFTLKRNFSLESGCKGKIICKLKGSRYLCEFDRPFCNIELEENEIVPWAPESKSFSLLNRVKLAEDVSEQDLRNRRTFAEDVIVHDLKKGTEGVIIMVYFNPSHAYEVEFYLGEEASPPFVSYAFEPEQLEFVSEDCNGPT